MKGDDRHHSAPVILRHGMLDTAASSRPLVGPATAHAPSAVLRLDILIAALSLAIGMAFLWHNLSQPFFYDETGYFALAQQLRERGLFGFLSELRTYLYPLLLAGLQLMTIPSDRGMRIAAFAMQWAGLCYVAIALSRRARIAWDNPRVGSFCFAAILLNPWLLQACSLLLTDVIFLTFVVAAVVRVLPEDDDPRQWALWVPALLAAAMMVRPAGALLLGSGLLMVAVRVGVAWRKRVHFPAAFGRSLVAGLFGVVAVIVVLAPQTTMNLQQFHKATPLIAVNLGEQQLHAGLFVLKYRTIVIPGEDPALTTLSPLGHSGSLGERLAQTSCHPYLSCVWKWPLATAFAIGAHALALLDWDELHTYSSSLGSIWRWLAVVPLYLFWYLALCGWWFRRQFSLGARREIYLLIGAAAVYALPLVAVQVEARFAYPLYVLSTPLAAAGLVALPGHWHGWLRPRRLLFVGGAAAWLVGMAAFSVWMDLLTGRAELFKYMRHFA